MAGPVASIITLPDDTGNAGKKVRTQQRSISGNTIQEHFFIPTNQYTILGKYFFSSVQQTVAASVQNGTSTGFFWLTNPASSTMVAVIRRIIADCNAGSALATPTAPVISFTKYTFTGTPGGVAVLPAKCQTSTPTAQFIVYNTVTGQTVTLDKDVGQFAIPSAETAVGILYAQKEVIARNPLAFMRGTDLELAPGEGLAVWQSVAGTSSDTRRFGIQIEWDECDVS